MKFLKKVINNLQQNQHIDDDFLNKLYENIQLINIREKLKKELKKKKYDCEKKKQKFGVKKNIDNKIIYENIDIVENISAINGQAITLFTEYKFKGHECKMIQYIYRDLKTKYLSKLPDISLINNKSIYEYILKLATYYDAKKNDYYTKFFQIKYFNWMNEKNAKYPNSMIDECFNRLLSLKINKYDKFEEKIDY